MRTLLVVLVQTALIVALAPLWNGVVSAIKARLQMRRGAPVWQRYRDLFSSCLSSSPSCLTRFPYAAQSPACIACCASLSPA